MTNNPEATPPVPAPPFKLGDIVVAEPVPNGPSTPCMRVNAITLYANGDIPTAHCVWVTDDGDWTEGSFPANHLRPVPSTYGKVEGFQPLSLVTDYPEPCVSEQSETP